MCSTLLTDGNPPKSYLLPYLFINNLMPGELKLYMSALIVTYILTFLPWSPERSFLFLFPYSFDNPLAVTASPTHFLMDQFSHLHYPPIFESRLARQIHIGASSSICVFSFLINTSFLYRHTYWDLLVIKLYVSHIWRMVILMLFNIVDHEIVASYGKRVCGFSCLRLTNQCCCFACNSLSPYATMWGILPWVWSKSIKTNKNREGE